MRLFRYDGWRHYADLGTWHDMKIWTFFWMRRITWHQQYILTSETENNNQLQFFGSFIQKLKIQIVVYRKPTHQQIFELKIKSPPLNWKNAVKSLYDSTKNNWSNSKKINEQFPKLQRNVENNNKTIKIFKIIRTKYLTIEL